MSQAYNEHEKKINGWRNRTALIRRRINQLTPKKWTALVAYYHFVLEICEIFYQIWFFFFYLFIFFPFFFIFPTYILACDQHEIQLMKEVIFPWG